MKKLIELFLILALCAVTVYSDYFSSLSDMEQLIQTEAKIISNIESLINAHEEKLDLLRSKLNEVKQEHKVAESDVTEYISNPVNAYLLTKRLTVDWESVKEFLSFDVVSQLRESLQFPSTEDLNGAAVALTRLQDTYELDTKKIAQGILGEMQYGIKMSAVDCFEIGRQLYNNEDYYHAVLWMEEALSRYDENAYYIQKVDKNEILDYLQFAKYKLGDVVAALNITNEMLALNPDDQHVIENKKSYQSLCDSLNNNTDTAVKYERPIKTEYDLCERSTYEKACRGELSQSMQQQSKLKCRYITNNIPFLLIAPMKQEEVSSSPNIVVFHDVLYDSEIEHLIKNSKPKLERAGVQDFTTGASRSSTTRVSKITWFGHYEDKVTERLSQRINDFTGLSLETAEKLQTINYGIGGHYEPHHDYSTNIENNLWVQDGLGNRIATVLFYMTDVTQGGATVFPYANVTLWPRKGSAAFWYNLFKDGQGDSLTLHAACPVLVGTKWVLNEWIHERGQEFIRPCALTQDSKKK